MANRRFLCATKDSVTGYAMVLSETSYNMACSFLEENAGRLGEFRGTKKVIVKGRDLTALKFDKRTFFYDEGRGYLLGE